MTFTKLKQNYKTKYKNEKYMEKEKDYAGF